MKFQENVIREYLKNVYFVAGRLAEERQLFQES